MTRRRRAMAAFIRSSAAVLMIGGGAASAGDGIRPRRVATGLDQPVAFTFDPRGRIWYVGKASGEVRVLNLERDSDRLFYRFSGVSSEGERGALGVALHPDYPQTPFVYVFVTRGPGSHPLENQIVRLRDDGGRGSHAKIILRSPTTTRTNHNGGRILFGPDGMLYAVVGDGGVDQATAQDLDDVRGKVLRMTPSGGVPSDNPFTSLVFSFGLRNSFGFDFDPQTGDLWETENGPECNDELNRIQAGANTRGVRASTAGTLRRRSTRTPTARFRGCFRSSSSRPRSPLREWRSATAARSALGRRARSSSARAKPARCIR
jgi:glucose/arabinose dehydrogenase